MGRLARIALAVLIVAGIAISLGLFLLGLYALRHASALAWWGLILISLPILALLGLLPLIWVWRSRTAEDTP